MRLWISRAKFGHSLYSGRDVEVSQETENKKENGPT